MITVVLVSAGIGVAIGASVGWKLGRGYERVRPRKRRKTSTKKKR